MSEISRTSQNNRLAYTSDNNRLSVNRDSTQTNNTGEADSAGREDYLKNYIIAKQKQIENGDTHDGSLAQQKAWVEEAIQMLHSEFRDTSDWPGSESKFVGFQSFKSPTDTAHSDTQKHFIYRIGNSSSVIVDRGDPNDLRPTTAEFIRMNDNHLYLPDNASDVTYLYNEATKTVTVQIDVPGGGTKTLIYRDINPKTFKLKIEAGNPDHVKANLDGLGDLKKNVTVTQHKNEATGEGDENTRLGDQTTKKDSDGNPLYDITDPKNLLNLFPMSDGTDQTTTVRTVGTVNLTPNSNTEYYKVSYDAGSGMYKVEVYQTKEDSISDPPVIKETINVDQSLVQMLNLNINSSRIYFDPKTLGNPDGSLNKSNPNAKKIQLISAQSGQAGQPIVSGDAAVTSFRDENGKKVAVYSYPNGQADGKPTILTANLDDEVSTHDVTAGGTIIINPPSDNKIDVKYDPTTKKFTFTVSSAGKTAETFIIDASQAPSIFLNTVAGNVKGLSTLPPEVRDMVQFNEVTPSSGPPAWLKSLNGQGHPGLFPNEAHSEQAYDLTKMMQKAFDKNDWSEVNNWLADLKDNAANDVVRCTVSAISKMAKGDKNIFNRLMKQIPPETRKAMIEAALREPDEYGEKGETEIGTTEEVVNMIQATLE